jgi:hypothetical protein
MPAAISALNSAPSSLLSSRSSSFAGQRSLDSPAGCCLLARQRASHPHPVVELLLCRAALSRALSCCAVHEVGRNASHPISGVGHNASWCSSLPPLYQNSARSTAKPCSLGVRSVSRPPMIALATRRTPAGAQLAAGRTQKRRMADVVRRPVGFDATCHRDKAAMNPAGTPA